MSMEFESYFKFIMDAASDRGYRLKLSNVMPDRFDLFLGDKIVLSDLTLSQIGRKMSWTRERDKWWDDRKRGHCTGLDLLTKGLAS